MRPRIFVIGSEENFNLAKTELPKHFFSRQVIINDTRRFKEKDELLFLGDKDDKFVLISELMYKLGLDSMRYSILSAIYEGYSVAYYTRYRGV